jgi:starch synthase
MSTLRVLFCASEMTPFSKTGGLADVTGALPAALAKQGFDVTCVVPLYPSMLKDSASLRHTGKGFTVRLGTMREDFTVHEATRDGVRVLLLACPRLFDRPGLYGEAGKDYPDNCRRFAMFSKACLDLADSFDLDPAVYHVHDWQTGLIPVYLSRVAGRAARSLLTIHNLAYQGLFPFEELHWTGLDPAYFHWQRLEYHGKVSLLKGGLVFTDAITTVSPTYSHEIQQREFGCGLDGILKERADRVYGILNGIDASAWNPETDSLLPARYSSGDLRGKAVCREALFEKAGLEPTANPLLGVVTRLAEQKGIDILLPALQTLVREGYPTVILGEGTPEYEQKLRELHAEFPARLGLFVAFNDALAHLIEAGSDIFLMPSRFEPCGLNQFYSMRYGTVPLVRATGGLADSVHAFSPEGARQGRSTGFLFRPYDAAALLETAREAITVFADKKMWIQLMRNGMKQDFGWDRSAERYGQLYRKLAEG